MRVVEVASGEPFDRFARERIFDPLGMKDTGFRPSPDQLSRIATEYRGADGALTKVDDKLIFLNSPTYLSGGGGLESSSEDYLQFAQMLANRGELNGKRLLGPNTVELMSSVFVPDTLPGRAKGRGFGLSVQVITDRVAARHAHAPTEASAGTAHSGRTFGWSPKEKIVGAIHGAGRWPEPFNEPGFRECGHAGSHRSE